LRNIIFIIIGLFIVSCSQEQDATVVPSDGFFDLANYFEKEVVYLNQHQKSIQKTIQLNGTKETQTLDGIDFEKELKVFANSNINKIAWLDAYQVDSVRVGGKLQSLHYKTQNPKLKTKEISILFKDDKVNSIKVLNISKTALADTEQRLEYKSRKAYHIENIQKVSLMDNQKMIIDVQF